MSKALSDGLTLAVNDTLKEGAKVEEKIPLTVPAKSLIKQHAGFGFVLLGGLSPAVQLIRRKNLSFNSVLRKTWMSAALLGVPLGGAVGYARVKPLSAAETDRWHTANFKDRKLLQATDFAVIGGTLGSLVIPTLLLKRARLVNGLLGGAALGSVTGSVSSVFV